VVKYNDYQDTNKQNNKRVTIKQQTSNKQVTTNNKDNKLNKDNKVIKDTLPPYQQIVTYLNQKIGTSYKSTSQKTQGFIKARFNNGFTLENFYKVIDIKYNEWFKTDMAKFLRPETLFGNKFEGYLNQVEDKKEVPTNRYDNVEMKFEE
jgi:uncharacterized phage protein (TIGR02220 family)